MIEQHSQIQRDIYTVSRLNREVRAMLEGSFSSLWLEGEISNLAQPRSGHIYFSLKDEFAQVRCAMFRMQVGKLPFTPTDGMQVTVRAKVGLYEARGDFQLVVEHMEESGDGALLRAYEALKQRLDEEGLFALEHKRPLPTLPSCIGVVTSPSGAAIRDILTVLKRRFPAIPVIIYPTTVQGEAAAGEIAAQIQLANQRRECDVLIVGRGGGSLEDLWPFNEEIVARAIHDSKLPIVSAVGHEVDVSISDLVADLRAPTPSAAAELLTPDRDTWLTSLQRTENRLQQLNQQQLRRWQQTIDTLRNRLKDPRQRLQERAQRLDELELRLGKAQKNILRHRQASLQTRQALLQRHNPLSRLQQLTQTCSQLSHRLQQAMTQSLQQKNLRLSKHSHALDTVSPLATLGRGYAIVTDTRGKVLQQVNQVKIGDNIQARLHRGQLQCRVEEIKE